MKLFNSKKQQEIDALDLPFTCKVVDIKHLKKDWRLAITDKNTVILLKGTRVVSQFNAIKDFMLAENGMAMATLENDSNIIFNKEGDKICIPHEENYLFPNGFHRIRIANSLSLYNSLNMKVGDNLKAVNVFPNGFYHMSIFNNGDAKHAGVFNEQGKKLLLTNTTNVEVFSNGWFIAGGMLYDNLGNLVLGMENGHFPKRWKINLWGRIMPKRKEKTNK